MSTDRPHVGEFAGQHVLAELHHIAPSVLDDVDLLRDRLITALTTAGASVCDVVAHRFDPHGATVLALLTESHASVHTYPEVGSVFLDVFTCGPRADPELAVRLFADYLGGTVEMTTVHRGEHSAAIAQPPRSTP